MRWKLGFVFVVTGWMYSAVAASNLPGNFDTFSLAISYHNDFCARSPNLGECATGAPALNGMVLHGLWPDRQDDDKNTYGYCDLPPARINGNWCGADIDVKGQLPAADFTLLQTHVPGTDACLYNHEWYAHGTCSGLNLATYFEDAVALATAFQALPRFNALVARSAGQLVNRADLQDALDQDLGVGSGDSAVILCRTDRSTNSVYFAQVLVALDKQRFMDFPATSSLAKLKPHVGKNGAKTKDTGNCPVAGIMISR